MRYVALIILMLVVCSSGAAAGPRGNDGAAPQTPAASGLPPAFVRLDGAVKTAAGDARTGTVVLVVSLYANQTDATPLWSEEQSIVLDAAGRYTVFAGASRAEGLPKELFGGNRAQWLGVAVKGEAEEPRVGLVSVPYALKAQEAETIAGRSVTDLVFAENLNDSVKAAMEAQASVAGTAGALRTAGGGVAFPAAGTPIANRLLKYTDGAGNVDSSAVIDNGGQLAVIGLGTHAFTGSGEGANILFVANTLSGPRNYADIQAFAGNVTTLFRTFSQGYATGTWDAAGGAALYNNGAGGMSLVANNPTGTIRFYPGGETERMRLQTDGTLRVSGFGTHAFTGAGAGGNVLYVANTLSGPSNYADIQSFAGNVTTLFRTFSQGYSTGTWDVAGGAALYNNGAGGMSLVANNPTGAIRFYPGGTTERVRIDAAGNVGIGTASPSTKLHVVGDVTVSGNIGAKYQDVAEWVETVERLEVGTVVIVDPVESNRVVPSSGAYDTRVAGAVSRQPGLVLGEPGDTKSLIAQSGRVRVKVDATYGAVKPGDLLVTSPTPGYAMRSKPMKVSGQQLHRPGTLLGKALEGLPGGKGEILVLLTLQ